MADVVTRPTAGVGSKSYVEWGAVFAGAVAAIALSIVLLAFGAAVGLASVSPWTSTAKGLQAVGIGSAFWTLLVTVWAFALGGYLSGRMRHRWNDGAATEVEFRDSTHGLLVWGVAILFGAISAAAGVTALGKGAAAAAGQAASQSSIDPITMANDTLFRPSTSTATGASEDTRGEVARLILRSRYDVAAADRTYLSQLVAAKTGLAPAEAEKRVNETVVQLKSAADQARKIAVIVGFLTSSILLIGAAVAWWAAAVGGKHRDEGTNWAGFTVVKEF